MGFIPEPAQNRVKVLKIIGGYARGVELISPADDGLTRPTTGRSREALFGSLGDLTGLRVLDLFSGSGALGLEAASRGAAEVLLVERDSLRAREIESNIARVKRSGVPGEIRLCVCDATHPERYLGEGGFDVVLSDPPYASSFAAFSQLAGSQGTFFSGFSGAILVWELPDAPGAAGEFIELAVASDAQWRLRKFGGTDFLWLEL